MVVERLDLSDDVTIYQGDCLDILPTLPAESVHCCVTSPPYWGLRDYGVDGQLGLEPTPEEYVAKMVDVFREVRRVLRADGTLWLNLGDSYAGSWGNYHPNSPPGKHGQRLKKTARWNRPAYESQAFLPPTANCHGLKEKDLVGIPWRVAFALQADGWYLRQDIIWHKPNPMPESVKDRCTKAHEYIFLLTKRPRYHFDQDAVKEQCQSGPSDIKKMRESLPRIGGKHKILVDTFCKASSSTNIGQKRSVGDPSGRNKRSVWTIPTAPFPGSHFAVFPQKLVEPCILAGCPEGGTVLDPFSGSGTTGLVAYKLRRKYIGIELSGEYVEMQGQRLGPELRQGRLF